MTPLGAISGKSIKSRPWKGEKAAGVALELAWGFPANGDLRSFQSADTQDSYKVCVKNTPFNNHANSPLGRPRRARLGAEGAAAAAAEVEADVVAVAVGAAAEAEAEAEAAAAAAATGADCTDATSDSSSSSSSMTTVAAAGAAAGAAAAAATMAAMASLHCNDFKYSSNKVCLLRTYPRPGTAPSSYGIETRSTGIEQSGDATCTLTAESRLRSKRSRSERVKEL